LSVCDIECLSRRLPVLRNKRACGIIERVYNAEYRQSPVTSNRVGRTVGHLAASARI